MWLRGERGQPIEVLRYFERIHRAALVMTGNPWDADDLAQETFCVLARESHRFAGRSSLYTWLYGILLNLERRHRRRSGIWRNKLRVLWGNETHQPREQAAAENRVEVEEWKRSLWGAVASLPDGQREVLVLRFSEQLSYEEIAEVMQSPLGTVKSRIHHGLAALRERITVSQADELRDVPRDVKEVFPRAI
jgi:RNA polymerase sigma-70 factor, ECF subfamily